MMMDPVAYKQLHESYMQNNNGTSGLEVFVTMAPSFFYPFLVVCLQTVMVANGAPTIPVRFLIEFIAIVWMVVLHCTVLNEHIYEIGCTLLGIAATIVAKTVINRMHVLPFVNQIPVHRPEFVACLRATISLVTAVCILAVDFKAFPRKLSKTETYGLSFMDMGVGLFVFSNAIADVLGTGGSTLTDRLTVDKLVKLLGSTAPLLVLGVARFVAVSELDYQKHTTEYGVHWNFFVTLALTRFASTLVLSLLPSIKYCKLAAVCVVVGHQIALVLGLGQWVNSDWVQRDTFITANREGIVSIPGYVGLYLSSVYLATLLQHKAQLVEAVPPIPPSDDYLPDTPPPSPEMCTARQLLRRALLMGVHALVLCKVAHDCQRTFGVSRRLADMGYTLWTLCLATAMCTLFMLLEVFYHFRVFARPRSSSAVTPAAGLSNSSHHEQPGEDDIGRYCPLLLSAVNYNGLAFFLGANLLTGLVNLTFQTLLVDAAGCVFIVTMYMFVLCAIVTFLYVNQIRLKF